MTRLVWDQAQPRYEAGVDRGVFYPRSGPGIVWNGLVSVQESPSGADEKTRYIDGIRTRTGRKPGDFSGTIQAFTYPDAMEDTFTRRRAPAFGMSYRTRTESSYKIHLVYNVILLPTSLMYQQEDVDAFSWEFTTLPVFMPGVRASAHLIIEADTAYPELIEALENVLYGDNDQDSWLPTPTELMAIFEEHSVLQIIDHGDGTWTAIGPDDVVSMLDPTTFQISWPSAVYINGWSYTVSSL